MGNVSFGKILNIFHFQPAILYT